MSKIVFQDAPGWRVLVDGVVDYIFDREIPALNRAAEILAGNPGALVTVVGPTGVSITVAGEQPEPPAEHEEPEQPEEPEDPENPGEEPEQPEEHESPPPLPPIEGEHPFYAVLRTMQPGEFRPVPILGFPAGVSNVEAMNATNWFDKSRQGTSGIGWTDRHVFDPETGCLFNVLIREQYDRSVTWLGPDLKMDGAVVPFNIGLDRRRPFNRLCDGGDGYMYFAPAQPSDQIGRLIRASYTNPGVWEDVGAPRIPATSLAGSQGDGSFALVRNLENGRFVMYTTGTGNGSHTPEGLLDFTQGRVWSWAPGEDTWTLEGRTQSCGYAGTLIYNPIRREVLVWGGSSAYSNAHPMGGYCIATLSTDGEFRRHGPCGLFYSAGNRRATYHPATGDYILMDQETTANRKIRIWIGDPPRGKPFRLMHFHARSEVFSGYDAWHRVCPLPGTDGLIWSDSIRGIILHRPLPWEALEGAVEVPIGLPGDTVPPGDEIPGGDDPVDEQPEEPTEPEPAPEPGDSEQPQRSTVGIIWLPEQQLPPMQEGERFPSLAGTRLAELIKACPRGGYVVMDDVRLPEAFGGWSAFLTHNQLHPSLSVGRDNQTWGSQAYFDRRRLMTLQVSDRKVQPASSPQRMVFTSYVAREHLFTHLPLTYAMPGKPHPYAQQALDDVRGYYYYMPLQSVIYQYVIDESRWNVIELRPGTSDHPWQAGCSWNEALDMLVTGDGNNPKKVARLRGWRPGMDGWEDLGELGHDCYHAHSRYSRVAGVQLFLGGNHNPRRVTLVDDTGAVHHMADVPAEIDGIPLEVSMAKRNLTDDPATGNFLLADMEQRVLWEYNPRLDKWAVGLDARSGQPKSAVWPGPYYGNVLIPISGTDAILWSSGYQPRIYRHEAVL